jgi:rhodanese-related sulfurtransferase
MSVGQAAQPELAAAHFRAKLCFETDVSDVHADLEAGAPGLVVLDTRNQLAWDAGHVPGAVHLPTAEIVVRAAELVPAGVTAVVYCWGPGCNGSTRAALELAQLGIPVKEMLGGYEYWVREGLPVETADRTLRRDPDPLTAPAAGIGCAC